MKKPHLFFWIASGLFTGLCLWWLALQSPPSTNGKKEAGVVKAPAYSPPVPVVAVEPEPVIPRLTVSTGLLQTLKSGKVDTGLWQAIIKLRDPRFLKEDVEKALLPMLSHPNALVRARACLTLAERGSTIGQQTALNIVDESNQGKVLEPLSLETSLTSLIQYRTPVPKEMVLALSKHFPEQRARFVTYTSDEFLPWWEEPIRKQASWNLDYLSTFHRASPDIVARLHAQRADSATRPDNHFLAEFHLYRVGENPEFFSEILKMAEIHLGRRKPPPAPDDSYRISWDTSLNAWEYVLYSTEPAALDLMRTVATDLSSDPLRKSMTYHQALGALFYLHRDYAFVDKLLMERLLACIDSIQKTGRNILTPYECQIMAVRGNPEFARLIHKHIPDLYYFVYYRDLPIESWIGLPRIPAPGTRVAIKGEP
jgi:hypothetical protein